MTSNTVWSLDTIVMVGSAVNANPMSQCDMSHIFFADNASLHNCVCYSSGGNASLLIHHSGQQSELVVTSLHTTF